MKSAKIFLTGMYLHLVLSLAVPIGILYFCQDGWNALGIGLLVFYLVMIAAVHLAGWICVAMAVIANRKDQEGGLLRGWKLLKLGAIPFHLLNFLYSFLAWFVLIGASRGILILLVPIPVFITCILIIQSGIVGICYLKCRFKKQNDAERPSGIHCVMQLLPVFDIISTVVILKKDTRRKGLNNGKTENTRDQKE